MAAADPSGGGYPLPRHRRVQGLPANETLEHFVLKWAAYRLLTRELGCAYALLEAGPPRARGRTSRHDALGVRLRPTRPSPVWVELPEGQVRLEVLDTHSGLWREVPAAELARHAADPTLRARRLDAGAAAVTVRAIRPGSTPGTVRLRQPGSERRQSAQLCAADAKQSRGDLQAWLREAPRRLRGVQCFLLVTPPGLARPEELPPRVGLAEVDTTHLVGADGTPAVRMIRWPESLRSAVRWDERRMLEFERRAYHALHGLLDRQLFWLLAQQALDRRRAAGAGSAPHEVRASGLRLYRPADREGVIGLWTRTGIARPWNDLGEEIDRHRRSQPGLLLVWEDPQSGVIGAGMGGWDGRRGWIYHLAVDPEHRHRGIARALVAALEEALLALGAPKIMLMVRNENCAVAGFYERLGYSAEDVQVRSKWLIPPAGRQA